MKEKIHFVILNITRWPSSRYSKRLYYGKMILCSNPDVNFQNIKDYSLEKLGESFDLTRTLTLQDAKLLDKDTYWQYYEFAWKRGDRETIRFSNLKQVLDAGISKHQEIFPDLPFISLMDGSKTRETITLNENDKYYRPWVVFDERGWYLDIFNPSSAYYDEIYCNEIIAEHGSIDAFLESESVKNSIEAAYKKPYLETDDYPFISLGRDYKP